MSYYQVKNCCQRHPEELLKTMNIGGMEIPYCKRCHEPKKNTMKPKAVMAMMSSNSFKDRVAVQKEVWKDKQTDYIGKAGLKARYYGGGKVLRSVHDYSGKDKKTHTKVVYYRQVPRPKKRARAKKK